MSDKKKWCGEETQEEIEFRRPGLDVDTSQLRHTGLISLCEYLCRATYVCINHRKCFVSPKASIMPKQNSKVSEQQASVVDTSVILGLGRWKQDYGVEASLGHVVVRSCLKNR